LEGKEIKIDDQEQNVNQLPNNKEQPNATPADGVYTVPEEDISAQDLLREIETSDQTAAQQAAVQAKEVMEGKYKELFDKYLRLQAEFDNYRKRQTKERQENLKYRYEPFFRDLLPLMDNFKRAFDVHSAEKLNEQMKNFLDGFRMIYQSIMSLLEGNGVKLMHALGDSFDPNLHDAIAREETSEHEPNTIIEELKPGYMYKDKVLIHPMVKVAVSPIPAQPDGEE